MNTKLKCVVIFLVLLTAIWMLPQRAPAQGISVSYQDFYNDLSPYGTWVNNPTWGYVWVPNVDPGFIPYSTNGYWIFTNEGWTWVSGYSWGWAPFHYGRWFNDPNWGPMWVPDNEWGPGWVTWRSSEDYYGWAPIAPGISINIAYGNNYYVPDNQWTFVRGRDFGRHNLNNYYVSSARNVTIIHNTTVINNPRENNSRTVRYNAGPGRSEVEKRAGKPIVPVTIRESQKHGQSLNNNQLQIYRPQVQKNVTSGPKPVPVRVENMNDFKTPAQRSAGNPKPAGNPQEVHHPLPPVKTGQPVQHQSLPPVRTGQTPQQQPVKPSSTQQQHPGQTPQQQPVKPPQTQQQHPGQTPHQQPVKPPQTQQQHPGQAPEQRHPSKPPSPQQQNHSQAPEQRQQSKPPASQQQHPGQAPQQQQPSQPHVAKPDDHKGGEIPPH